MTLLYAIDVPSSGGNTMFSNAIAAYAALPPAPSTGALGGAAPG